MFYILRKVISHYWEKYTRYGYWLLNLSKAEIADNVKIQFPVVAEGTGKIMVGKNSIFSKNCKLKIQANSRIEIESNVTLLENVELIISQESKFIVSSNVRIGEFSKIFISKDSIIGRNTFIAPFVSIFSREGKHASLTIGENCGIGDYTIIDLSDNITIQDNVAIGPNCIIYSHDHKYDDLSKAAWKGGLKISPVVIEENAWLGSRVTILPGIKVGNGAIVGAGSIVNRSIPANEIWAGVPAKKIKNR